MTGSAAAFALLGGACLFFPGELISAAGMSSMAELPVQLFAAGLLAIASLDWMGRGAIYGGIYGRPIVVANFGFGMITALSLVSAALDGRLESWAWLPALGFALHSVAFFRLMILPPWPGATPDVEKQSRRDST